MVKLFPPIIEGTLPAAAVKDGKAQIRIPFENNRSVGINDIDGFSVKIRTISNTIPTGAPNEGIVEIKNYNNNNNVLILDDIDYLQSSSFYKIQIAYIGKNSVSDTERGEIGYYSTVGILKCTNKPVIGIGTASTETYNIETITPEIFLTYENEDKTERLYSSHLIIYEDNDIFYDSGEVIHIRNSTEIDNSAVEIFKIYKDTNESKEYKITYSILTNNGYEETFNKSAVGMDNITGSYNGTVIATPNIEEGYIEISLEKITEDQDDSINAGDYYLIRKELNNNQWYVLKNLKVGYNSIKFGKFKYKDFCIESGKSYCYAIREHGDGGLISSIVPKNPEYVKCDFEYMFLYDGERQLKIKYNEKMSSYKTNTLEQKIETIGGKYPTIFRNGNVNYKEGNISGLISYGMDENNLFSNHNNIDDNLSRGKGYNEQGELIGVNPWTPGHTTGISAENFYLEKQFKNEVLEWLNDGKPKFLKTRAEGSFLVRVMQVSMSPEDTIGRMLHNFSATIYEIGNNDYNTLKKYNIIHEEEENQVFQGLVMGMKEFPIDFTLIKPNNSIQHSDSYTIELESSSDSTEFINFPSGTKIKYNDNSEEITIGPFGTFKIDTVIKKELTIILPENSVPRGIIKYRYNSSEYYINSYFNLITTIRSNTKIISEELNSNQNIINELYTYKTYKNIIKYIRFYNESKTDKVNITITLPDNKNVNLSIDPEGNLEYKNFDTNIYSIITDKPVMLTLGLIEKNIEYKKSDFEDLKKEAEKVSLESYTNCPKDDKSGEYYLAAMNNNQRLNYFICTSSDTEGGTSL